MEELNIPLVRLPNSAGLDLPQRATLESAGMDLLAAIDSSIVIDPGTHRVIPTGISIELPEGYEAQVRPRSGLAAKHGITILNSPGTIDPDYRGEIGAIIINLGNSPFEIMRGMRIAQLVVSKFVNFYWDEMENLGTTNRGEGGFGSTGTGKDE
ncbi:MAG: Deoxyuridine 5'-triphosphate nucleotidohydrolase [Alphaproteobacteria bacterium MarineAlpha3_Bin7]|nr:MAG: Deoxyuridine 5'-triphosphate nucleotidohydrolase [Alphaproteobacteria bacterium MarineAlpha3_Bin7]|tara:strand:+ start:2270 stop:2731 length:462 start_codon:yes stop_codon:yes gene_type:complete